MALSVIYPGTFDPITLGHINLLTRASKLFDEIIVAIAKNTGKNPLFNLDERTALAREALKALPKVTVKPFSTLLVEFAAAENCALILRGVRGTDDWEYEKQLAFMNSKLHPEIETIFMLPDSNFQHIASSLVKDVARHQGKIDNFVPEMWLQQFMNAFKKLRLPKFTSNASLNAIKTAIAVILGIVLCEALNIENTLWIVLTILVVMGSHYHVGGAILDASFRFIGTLLGALIALITLWFVPASAHVIHLIIIFFTVLWFSYIACSKSQIKEAGILGALTTVTILMASNASPTLALTRVIEISFGILIALIITKFLLPIHSRLSLLKNIAKNLKNYIKLYQNLYSEKTLSDKLATMQLHEQRIVEAFAEQRALIKEAKSEFGKLPFNKAIAESILNYEYRLYRSLIFLSNAINKEPKHFQNLIRLPGFTQLNEAIIQQLDQLSLALENQTSLTPTTELENLLCHFEAKVGKLKIETDIERIQVDTISFCMRHIVDEISVLTMLIGSYKQS